MEDGNGRRRWPSAMSVSVPMDPLVVTLKGKEYGGEIRFSVLEEMEVVDSKGEEDKEMEEQDKLGDKEEVRVTKRKKGSPSADKEVQVEEKPLPIPIFKEVDEMRMQEDERIWIKWQKPLHKEDQVDYECDEVDQAWLVQMNKMRAGMEEVTVEQMEMIIDGLEKSSYLHIEEGGDVQVPGYLEEDEAVCCICMDGECVNTDLIIFCDVCNIAVHQECYGVPYIPEGAWLCRRCLASPSREVDCIFCPNKGGAYKQTEDGRWAHVACTLWIPEVCFSNLSLLEPVEGISLIPPARWRLTCSICKCKGLGACIQCNKASCYSAFHVSCARLAEIYMKIEYSYKGETEIVKKIAYCNKHAPPDHTIKELNSPTLRQKLKACRKVLEEQRNAKRTVCVPMIEPENLMKITSLVSSFPGMDGFIRALVSYWKLKRIQRNGLPLLRSLQTVSAPKRVVQGFGRESMDVEESHFVETNRTDSKSRKKRVATARVSVMSQKIAKKSREMDSTLKEIKKKRRLSSSGSAKSSGTHRWTVEELECARKIRQQMEHVRMLCEMVKKRELKKLLSIELAQDVWELDKHPLSRFFVSVVDALMAKDTRGIFCEPVDTNLVADYLEIISNPIDLKTMKDKASSMHYDSLEELKRDFELMIDNCLLYNPRDTTFFKAGLRLREEAYIIFNHAEDELRRQELVKNIQCTTPTGTPRTRSKNKISAPSPIDEAVFVKKIDKFINSSNRKNMSQSEQISTLRLFLAETLELLSGEVRKVQYELILKELIHLQQAGYKEQKGQVNDRTQASKEEPPTFVLSSLDASSSNLLERRTRNKSYSNSVFYSKSLPTPLVPHSPRKQPKHAYED